MKYISFSALLIVLSIAGRKSDSHFFFHAFDKSSLILSQLNLLQNGSQIVVGYLAENLNSSRSQERARAQRAYEEQQKVAAENKLFLQQVKAQSTHQPFKYNLYSPYDNNSSTSSTVSSPLKSSSEPLADHEQLLQKFSQDYHNDDYQKRRKDALVHDIQHQWQADYYLFMISDDGKKVLDDLYIDAKPLTTFYGTKLQRVLYAEAIECIDRAGILFTNPSKTIQSIARVVASSSCASVEYNRLKGIEKSCRLLDFCHAMLEYSSAIVDLGVTAGEGVLAGIENTVETAGLIEQHAFAFAANPVEQTKKFYTALQNAALSLSQILENFCPKIVNSEVDIDLAVYHDRNQQVIDRWRLLLDDCWTTLKNTPARQLVKGSVKFITESIILEKSFSALGSLVGAAQKELQSADFVLSPQASPGFLLLENASSARNIISFAERTNIATTEEVLAALKNLELPAIGGSISHLNEAIHAFESTEKFIEVFAKVISGHDIESLGTAKGAMFEIQAALGYMKEGENILSFSYKIKGREYDILTTNKLVECKNIAWEKLNARKIKDIRGTFGQGVCNARELGKSFELCSANPIPEDIKRWLVSREISFIEGKI